MHTYTIIKDETTNVNNKIMLSLNDFYNICDMCFYIAPVQETDDLNYTITDDNTDKYYNINY